MKRNKLTILLFILVITLTFISRVNAVVNNYIDPRFNDINFYNCVKNAVGSSGVQSDGYTLKNSALNNLEILQCNNKNISDVTGLELMPKLNHLELEGNKITSINLTKNTMLYALYLSVNKLSSLNLSKNTKLGYLYLFDNKLTTIDLSKNTQLLALNLTGNRLTSINLLKNTQLVNLDLSFNQLTTVNLSNNTKLLTLGLAQNKLKIIDLSKNNKLNTLDLQSNYFSSRPSKCTSLGSNCYFGYIIKFNSNGGSSVSTQNGYYIEKPTNPTRSGYTFVGWYKDSSLTTPASFPQFINSNTTYYAKWKSSATCAQTNVVINGPKGTIPADYFNTWILENKSNNGATISNIKWSISPTLSGDVINTYNNNTVLKFKTSHLDMRTLTVSYRVNGNTCPTKIIKLFVIGTRDPGNVTCKNYPAIIEGPTNVILNDTNLYKVYSSSDKYPISDIKWSLVSKDKGATGEVVKEGYNVTLTTEGDREILVNYNLNGQSCSASLPISVITNEELNTCPVDETIIRGLNHIELNKEVEYELESDSDVTNIKWSVPEGFNIISNSDNKLVIKTTKTASGIVEVDYTYGDNCSSKAMLYVIANNDMNNRTTDLASEVEINNTFNKDSLYVVICGGILVIILTVLYMMKYREKANN